MWDIKKKELEGRGCACELFTHEMKEKAGFGKGGEKNFEGVLTTYTEPEHYENVCYCDVCTGKKKILNPLNGVASLAAGITQKSLEPDKLLRRDRKKAWSR